MKRYKRLYVVLAVLLAACIATFALSRYKAQKEQIQTSGETILSISADEVESLSWDYDGQTLSFHRDGAWSYDATRPSRWTPSRWIYFWSFAPSAPPSSSKMWTIWAVRPG